MPVYDIDGDGDVQANSDGLLILKYIVGYRGDDLVSGSPPNASGSRPTAPLVEAYIQSIWRMLDVTGDGVVDYNDALLIILYIGGLRDHNLIQYGSISGGSARNTADLIEAYIAKMVA